MFVIKYTKVFFIISVLLLAVSFYGFFAEGINLGIDFTGGTVLDVSYTTRPERENVVKALDALEIGTYNLQPSGDKNFVLRTKTLSPETKNLILKALTVSATDVPKEEKFNSIGPTIGSELRRKAGIAITLVVLCIVLFVTFAFRKVSRPVSSWKYGLATIIALMHDIVIPAGLYVLLSPWHGGEIDLLFVTGLLAILGYSVHDTIVVFDRVRENLRVNDETRRKVDFRTVVGESVGQTFGRSINTSVTIFLALIALFFIGAESTRAFAFLLVVGVIAGTYSSIFIASPLLVLFEKWQKK